MRYSKYLDSTYTFFQDLQKIFESRLIVQIYLHICDILNPITTHPHTSTPLVSFTKSLLIIYTKATKCFVRFVGFLTLSRLNLSLDPLLRLIGVEYGCT